MELAAMADLAPEVTIVAIQPGEIAPGYEMTEAAQAAVVEAAGKARELLGAGKG